LGFSQYDFSGSPVAGTANFNANFGATVPAGTVYNDYENFDNEYVWHCHILGHEEFDFMRPISFHPFTQNAAGAWVVPGTTISAVPAAPTIGAATIAAGGVTVAWADNSTTEYQFSVERAPVTVKGATTTIGAYAAIGTARANATSYVDANAVAGQSYSYRVVAVGAKGTATSAAVTASAPVVIPAAPAAPTATAITATSLTLNWNAVTGATGYTVYQNGVALAAVTGTAVTRNITGLTAATTYTYTVTANNTAGSSAQSGVLSVNTAAAPVVAIPATPRAPTATRGARGSLAITVTWTAVANATSYTVMESKSTNGRTWSTPAATVTGVTGLSYVDTGLTAGTQYRFTIIATNAAGSSAASPASAAVTAR
jgi:fibronectin type 3 domain-containing protein